MNKQFTVAGITFQENHWVNGEEDTILLSPSQYAKLESLLYALLKDSLVSVLTDDNTEETLAKEIARAEEELEKLRNQGQTEKGVL